MTLGTSFCRQTTKMDTEEYYDYSQSSPFLEEFDNPFSNKPFIDELEENYRKLWQFRSCVDSWTLKVIFIKMRQNHNFETWRIEGECFQESLIIPLNSTSSHSHLHQR